MVASLEEGLKEKSLGRGVVMAALSPLVTAILAALIIFALFTTGMRRGMDGAIAIGESEQTAWAVAISEMVYGLDSYVAHTAVVDAIIRGVRNGTGGPADPKFRENLNNPDLLNAALSAALALGPQPEGFVAQRTLTTMLYDDIGIVDYDKIAFSLFGFRVQSLYYLFFVIVSLSTAAFLLQFWGKPVAQVLLLSNLAAFWLELNADIFMPDMPSFWGMRHGSTLAILPMWHLALLLVWRTRLSLSAVVLASVQVAILVFATRIRGSAAWTVIFLACLSAFLAYRFWRSLEADQTSLFKVARAALRWPFVLLLIGLATSKIYTSGKLHPSYFTDDIMPYHGAWHSAYLGMIISPTFWATTGKDSGAWGDAIAYEVALRYLREKGFIAKEGDYISPWTQTYKMRLHDRTMRAIYLDLVREYPFTTLGLYLYHKPLWVQAFIAPKLRLTSEEAWLVIFLGAVVMAIVTAVARRPTAAEMRSAFWLGLAAAVFSSLPNIWAYTGNQTATDVLLSTMIFVVLLTWMVCSQVLILLRDRKSARGPNTLYGPFASRRGAQ
ncbi:MAG: hypothetical protein ISP49_00675 [Reyranella sp.]|nr:hypothetical protein [Reyranella sp.]MBL6650075.1 hypothetical protein [Reyranella sp.]